MASLKKKIIICIILMSVFFVSCDNKIELNFDRLFPQTPCKKIFDSCLHACQLCREFHVMHKKKSVKIEQELFADLLIGKLFCIKMSIADMKHMHAQDLFYLKKLFDEILHSVAKTKNQKLSYVTRLVRDIQTHFAKFKRFD